MPKPTKPNKENPRLERKAQRAEQQQEAKSSFVASLSPEDRLAILAKKPTPARIFQRIPEEN